MILIWNLGIGGMQKRIRDIVKDISDNYPDWEVHVLVRDYYPRLFNEEIACLNRVYVRYSPVNNFFLTKFSKLPWVVWEYFKVGPDVCLTFLSHLSSLLVIVKLLIFWKKSRLVLNEGILTSKFLQIHSKNVWLEEKFVRLFYRLADKIIVPTKAIKLELTGRYRLPSNLIVVIPNWTLFPKMKPLEPKFDLLYVGRFEKEKNLFAWIRVINKVREIIPDVTACLVGEGSQEKSLKVLLDNLNLKNNVTIFDKQRKPAEFYRRSKLLLMTTRNEGMPNTVLEAAMCQVPSIARRFDGVNEVIINNSTGYIAAGRDEIVANIVNLLRHDKKRLEMGKNAWRYVKRHFGYLNQKMFIETIQS